MANEEQLEILKQGVDVWNQWREENPDEAIDLTEADISETYLLKANLHSARLTRTNLRESDLREADLNRADLRGANLRRVNLCRANLSEANLLEANLTRADLRRSNLSKANLTKASLFRADFREADLSEANLSKADLNEANLSEANLAKANLDDANLSEANCSEADFSGANLFQAYLFETDLHEARLSEANLIAAELFEADLSEADLAQARLRSANLREANLHRANFREANLCEASFRGANLNEAVLSGADLTGADLSFAILVGTKVNKARISGISIYGISVWDLKGEFEEQKDLIITRKGEPIITVDNIKVAQFIYLILNNEEVRGALNTLTSKSVLILGRFALPERRAILDALRNKLREYDLLPIVFDFDRPTDKDFTETIKTLAGLSYFVIADVTNPKSSPLELQATVPDYQIPFVPIIQEGEQPFAMMVDLQKKYNWVLNTITYDSVETLIKILKPLIIDPAMSKSQELRLIKARRPEVISGKDFLDKAKE